MRDKAEVVIVGAGIMGLSIAYNLAKVHGVTDVTVLDRSYLCGGASGRNGGGSARSSPPRRTSGSCRSPSASAGTSPTP